MFVAGMAVNAKSVWIQNFCEAGAKPVRLVAGRPPRYAVLPAYLAPGVDCELPPAVVGRGPSAPD